MKKMFFHILILNVCFLSATTFAQTTNSNTRTTKKADSPIYGAWTSVDNKELLMISDGFFSSVAQDSAGKWSSFHAGSYTVDNANTLTFKVTHSSFAYRIGYLHTLEYDLNGRNLTINWYKKMIDPKAGDVTARVPKGAKLFL